MSAAPTSQVRLCADILPNGSRCQQFALKNKPPENNLWCHAHADPAQRERNADGRELVALIAGMDLFSVALALGNTVHELRARLIPPLHAQAILDAASDRLEELIGDLARAKSEPSASNSHPNNRLQAGPIK